MRVSDSESLRQRVAMLSISPKMIGAHFVIFWVQYAPGMALMLTARYQAWRRADADLAVIIPEALKESGPIGIGAAVNATAIIILAEVFMVLAQIVKKKQYETGRQEGIAEGRQEGIAEGRQEGIAEGRQEGIAEGRQEGIAEGRQEGIAEGRKQSAKRMRAWAKDRGIPEDELPIDPDDE